MDMHCECVCKARLHVKGLLSNYLLGIEEGVCKLHKILINISHL